MQTLFVAIAVAGLGTNVGRAEDLDPEVRLRPDGVIERFDWGVFRFVPTGSRFIPVQRGRINTSLRTRRFTPNRGYRKSAPVGPGRKSSPVRPRRKSPVFRPTERVAGKS